MEKAHFIKQYVLLRFVFYPLAKRLSKSIHGSRILPVHITIVWHICIFVGFVLCFFGLSSYGVLTIYAIALFLDCFDGQRARDANLTTASGKLFDDFGGDLFYALFWISFSVSHAYQPIGLTHPIELGASIAILSLLRNSFLYRAMALPNGHDAASTALPRRHDSPWRMLYRNMTSFGGLLFPILFLSVAMGLSYYIFYVFILLSALSLVATIRGVFRQIRTAGEVL